MNNKNEIIALEARLIDLSEPGNQNVHCNANKIKSSDNKCACVFVTEVSFVKYTPTNSKDGPIGSFAFGQWRLKQTKHCVFKLVAQKNCFTKYTSQN